MGTNQSATGGAGPATRTATLAAVPSGSASAPAAFASAPAAATIPARGGRSPGNGGRYDTKELFLLYPQMSKDYGDAQPAPK